MKSDKPKTRRPRAGKTAATRSLRPASAEAARLRVARRRRPFAEAGQEAAPELTQDGELDFAGWLNATYTDAIVILHEGRIIQETYTGETDVRNPHILMSVSKSVLGLLAGILVEKGLFDLSAGVTSIIPE